MFGYTGDVYVSFSSNDNGQANSNPVFPGLKTGLNWQIGDLFNLTISAKNKDTVLYINGTEYLTVNRGTASGFIGIKSTRFYQTTFTNFKLVSSTSVQSRNTDDYISYAGKGINLIVLNTNGYGYFANYLLNQGKQTIRTDEIHSSNNFLLPENLNCDPKFTKRKFREHYRILRIFKRFKYLCDRKRK